MQVLQDDIRYFADEAAWRKGAAAKGAVSLDNFFVTAEGGASGLFTIHAVPWPLICKADDPAQVQGAVGVRGRGHAVRALCNQPSSRPLRSLASCQHLICMSLYVSLLSLSLSISLFPLLLLCFAQAASWVEALEDFAYAGFEPGMVPGSDAAPSTLAAAARPASTQEAAAASRGGGGGGAVDDDGSEI